MRLWTLLVIIILSLSILMISGCTEGVRYRADFGVHVESLNPPTFVRVGPTPPAPNVGDPVERR